MEGGPDTTPETAPDRTQAAPQGGQQQQRLRHTVELLHIEIERAVGMQPRNRVCCVSCPFNPTSYADSIAVLLEDDHPKHLQSAADLSGTSLATWLRGRQTARADRARRNGRAPALPPQACS